MEPDGRSMEYHTLMSEKHTYPSPNVLMCIRANAELYNHFLLGPCVFTPVLLETHLKSVGFPNSNGEFL